MTDNKGRPTSHQEPGELGAGNFRTPGPRTAELQNPQKIKPMKPKTKKNKTNKNTRNGPALGVGVGRTQRKKTYMYRGKKQELQTDVSVRADE
jgi:hypothetical protein